MKDYQDLIGKALIAIAIVIAGVLISNAISAASGNMMGGMDSIGTLVRDGLIKVQEGLSQLAPAP